MSTKHDNEEWVLSAQVVWKPKHKDVQIPCDVCSGNGTTGGGFKSIDGPETCYKCFGRGFTIQYSTTAPPPKVPPELVDHMRKAWLEYNAEEGQ